MTGMSGFFGACMALRDGTVGVAMIFLELVIDQKSRRVFARVYATTITGKNDFTVMPIFLLLALLFFMMSGIILVFCISFVFKNGVVSEWVLP
jgi:hypothetical protein